MDNYILYVTVLYMSSLDESICLLHYYLNRYRNLPDTLLFPCVMFRIIPTEDLDRHLAIFLCSVRRDKFTATSSNSSSCIVKDCTVFLGHVYKI